MKHEINSGSYPIFVPNSITESTGFYISYNNRDNSIYGSDTTALVLGQMEKFYILNGNHRAQYQPLIIKGFDACLSYFIANIGSANKFSDKINADIIKR